MGVMLINIIPDVYCTIVYNPCSSGNGGCSHLCLLSTASQGFSCACPDGMILDGDSNCVPTGTRIITIVIYI